MEGVKIIKCSCAHEYQDEMHGAQMRVHNVSPKGIAKCTVCGSEKSSTASVSLSTATKAKAVKS
jgi:hypothetical protein